MSEERKREGEEEREKERKEREQTAIVWLLRAASLFRLCALMVGIVDIEGKAGKQGEPT